MTNFKELDVWKYSMQLVKDIYSISAVFPKEEKYGLVSQVRRAAISVPANIAEGMGRQYKKDTLQFLYIAHGSVYEMDTLLNAACMVEILKEDELKGISPSIEQLLRMLNGFIKYMERSLLR